MSKHIVLYQSNDEGEIVKIEMENGVWYIDGEVVEENETEAPPPPKNMWDNVWSFFYSHGATVGGNEWEEKHKNKNYNDNGREFDGQDWTYTKEANGEANPSECNYEAPQDYQGPVPTNLGIPMSGE